MPFHTCIVTGFRAFRKRNRQHSVGVGIAQVRLAEEGELADVVHGFDIVRRQAFLFHQMAVVGNVIPYMADLPDELFILNLQYFLPGRRFDLRLIVILHGTPPLLRRTGTLT